MLLLRYLGPRQGRVPGQDLSLGMIGKEEGWTGEEGGHTVRYWGNNGGLEAFVRGTRQVNRDVIARVGTLVQWQGNVCRGCCLGPVGGTQRSMVTPR
jgi:hypothetical protein